MTTPTVETSRTGTVSKATPTANDPIARVRKTLRNSHPYPRPTSRRRVVTHSQNSPPTAHCRRTVAASRLITGGRLPLGAGYCPTLRPHAPRSELCLRVARARRSCSWSAPARACPRTAGPRSGPTLSTRCRESRPASPMSTACSLASTESTGSISPRRTRSGASSAISSAGTTSCRRRPARSCASAMSRASLRTARADV